MLKIGEKFIYYLFNLGRATKSYMYYLINITCSITVLQSLKVRHCTKVCGVARFVQNNLFHKASGLGWVYVQIVIYEAISLVLSDCAKGLCPCDALKIHTITSGK